MLLERRYNALLSKRINNHDAADSETNEQLKSYLGYSNLKHSKNIVDEDPDVTNFQRVNNLGESSITI